MGVKSIQDLLDKKGKRGGFFSCEYSYGESILLELYETLGKEQFSAALRDIYLLAEPWDRWATELGIYEAFLSHTTVEELSEVKSIYAKLHGGNLGS